MVTTDPPEQADIVVVGAGIMGASIGYQLASQGDQRVVVIDERPPVGGVSGRTFGQIRQHYSNELMVRMALRGFEVIDNWHELIGHGDPGYVRMGYMLLVVEDQLDALERNIALGAGLGVETRFVGAAEIAEIEPLLVTDDLAGGVYEPNGGYIDVTKMVLSWLGAAQAHGATICSGVKVESIDEMDGATIGVSTSRGRVEAPTVVVAAGAWARDLLEPAGVPVPIEHRRLDMAYLTLPPGSRQIQCCITDGNSDLVLRPDMGRQVLAVAYPQVMPLVDDPLGSASAADHRAHLTRLDAAFAARIPEFRGAEVTRTVSGAYDITPDFHPILGWAPELDGLYLAVGFSGHGLKLSPAVGEMAAAAVLGLDPPFDVAPLRPTRFADDDLMYLAYGPGARA